jgi:hypothetical protein
MPKGARQGKPEHFSGFAHQTNPREFLSPNSLTVQTTSLHRSLESSHVHFIEVSL